MTESDSAQASNYLDFDIRIGPQTDGVYAINVVDSPAGEAEPIALVRRVYFDLIGLPPTFKEIQAFRADRKEYAYERAVNRLLESPHFGERWARHWLDVAGYADSEGGNSPVLVFQAVVPPQLGSLISIK